MSETTRLSISIDHQQLNVIRGGACVRSFVISTALKGMGFQEGSFRTPTGRFRIFEKIGDGEPSGTVFSARTAVGHWMPGDRPDEDLVLTRILRLDGLDAGNANTLERFIYIHGTNRADLLGTPSSHGCIRMDNADIVELFDMVGTGDEVEILPATVRRGKLLFVDCDSTLTAVEGIDELARLRGADVFEMVRALTDDAMNGLVPIHEVFPRRMEMISPDIAMCGRVGEAYIANIVPGARLLVEEAVRRGWLPVVLSGGFEPVIRPLAAHLGIGHVEAVPLSFHQDGSYAGYGSDYPTTRNLGKNEVIREWAAAMLPEKVVMIGDGVSDLETMPDVDLFAGFGGVVARPKVMGGCDRWLTVFDSASIAAVFDDAELIS